MPISASLQSSDANLMHHQSSDPKTQTTHDHSDSDDTSIDSISINNTSLTDNDSTDNLNISHHNSNAAKSIVIVGAGMAGSRLAIMLATAFKTLSHSAVTTNPDTTNSDTTNSDTTNSDTTNSDSANTDSAKTDTANTDTAQNVLNAELNQDFNMPSITLISKEAQVGYNRIMLSPVLAGEKKFDDIYLYTNKDYERLGINVLAGVSVETIDTKAQSLSLDNCKTLEYDKLVLATGSTARVIPFEGHKASQVHVFRDVEDVDKLTAYARQGKTGLVIGGGVLGLEAACALSAQGANMTVIHVDEYVLNRQLDKAAALMLQDELARRNVGLEVSAMSQTIKLDDNGDVVGLAMKDGRVIPADFIVMAVGIAPNIELAAASGIEVNRGIIVDTFMQTNCANVYGIGECVEINDELFGMVSSVNQHIDSLISVLTNNDKPNWQPFVSVPLSLKLKVSGVAVFSAGQIEFNDKERDAIETIVYRQQGGGLQTTSADANAHYQCLYIKDNKLIGAVLYGETSEGAFYSHLINEQIDITSIKDDLIYGEVYCSLDASTKLDTRTEDDDPINVDSPTITSTIDQPNRLTATG